jgi:hypothetical protein
MPAKKPATKSSAKTAKHAAHRTTRTAKNTSAGDEVVTIDRRRSARRGAAETSTETPAAAPSHAPATPVAGMERRKKVQRRRQIDPTTCERDYSVEEVEFMNAMDDYKRKSGRMFPTCSEVLEVIRGMGYVKLSSSERALLSTVESLSARLDAVTETVDALVDETL